MVRMKSKTVFAHDRITVFSDDGPQEGVLGGVVMTGQEFETDIVHAKELDKLGHAEPLNPSDLDGEADPLQPHYTVSVAQMRAQDPTWSPTVTPGTTFPSTGQIVPATDGRPVVRNAASRKV